MTRVAARKKSSLVSNFWISCLCSDLFPLSTNLQIEQGCLPLNVLTSASLSGAVCEYSATIVIQATDCKTAQCPPNANVSVTTASHRTGLDDMTNTLPPESRSSTGKTFTVPKAEKGVRFDDKAT